MAGHLRSVDGLLLPAVQETIRSLALTEADSGAVALAKQYARAIDDTGSLALEQLGPKLLACLESLGATPRARSAQKGGGAGAGKGKLADLRNARAG